MKRADPPKTTGFPFSTHWGGDHEKFLRMLVSVRQGAPRPIVESTMRSPQVKVGLLCGPAVPAVYIP